MEKCEFTKKAVQDLNEIWEYTYEAWSERQADKYYYLIYQTCLTLASSPNLGRHYPQINPHILGYTAYRHFILFERRPDKSILVIRILHGRRDLKNYKIKRNKI
jgi:toxin ParE1/3/4